MVGGIQSWTRTFNERRELTLTEARAARQGGSGQGASALAACAVASREGFSLPNRHMPAIG